MVRSKFGAWVSNALNVDLRLVSARITGLLLRRFGADHFDLVEDAVQDSVLAALRSWSFHGMPDDPSAWLLRVAKNRALDRIRAEKRLDTEVDVAEIFAPPDRFGDDEIRLLFLCCHPSVGTADQIALTLKTSARFGNREIARALLTTEVAIAQRLVRAKTRIRTSSIPLDLPLDSALHSRRDAVLRVIYLIFNEGYSTTGPALSIDSDLCDTAISLAERLIRTDVGAVPESYALLSLMLFHRARLETRIGMDGLLCNLENQNRGRWNHDFARQGLIALDVATAGRRITKYHVEAALAAEHTLAPSFAESNWNRIVELYDDLLHIKPTLDARISRAVAVGLASNIELGCAILDELGTSATAGQSATFHAAKAWMMTRRGQDASETFLKAAAFAKNEAERAFLVSKAESSRSA